MLYTRKPTHNVKVFHELGTSIAHVYIITEERILHFNFLDQSPQSNVFTYLCMSMTYLVIKKPDFEHHPLFLVAGRHPMVHVYVTQGVSQQQSIPAALKFGKISRMP